MCLCSSLLVSLGHGCSLPSLPCELVRSNDNKQLKKDKKKKKQQLKRGKKWQVSVFPILLNISVLAKNAFIN
jgi:hypothetical protein